VKSKPESFHPMWAAAAGPVTVLLALLAHIVSGGSAPAAPIIAALAALAAMIAAALARTRMRSWVLVAVLGVAQQILHILFDRLAVTFGQSVGTGAQNHGHAVPDESLTPVGGSGISGGVGSAHAMDLMLNTHAAAALLTALILTKGESALLAVSALLRRQAVPARYRDDVGESAIGGPSRKPPAGISRSKEDRERGALHLPRSQ
jgi:hypothetical protein